jgi:hypothetical protein
LDGQDIEIYLEAGEEEPLREMAWEELASGIEIEQPLV